LTETGPALPVLQALAALVAWLKRTRIPHVVIGGVAIGAVGRPRMTKDVDVVVFIGARSWEDFENEARSAGFPPRIENAARFAHGSRVFLLVHAATGVDVDISVGALTFEEETIARARLVAFGGGVEVPVATPEDLIVMKIVASRVRRPREAHRACTRRREIGFYPPDRSSSASRASVSSRSSRLFQWTSGCDAKAWR